MPFFHISTDLNNEIGEKSLFPRTQKDCIFFIGVRSGGRLYGGRGEGGRIRGSREVSVVVYKDGGFARRSQEDGRTGTDRQGG